MMALNNQDLVLFIERLLFTARQSDFFRSHCTLSLAFESPHRPSKHEPKSRLRVHEVSCRALGSNPEKLNRRYPRSTAEYGQRQRSFISQMFVSQRDAAFRSPNPWVLNFYRSTAMRSDFRASAPVPQKTRQSCSRSYPCTPQFRHGLRMGSAEMHAGCHKIGVGTMSPTATLEVVAGATTLADSWTTRSSRRFKTNIRPLSGALEKISQLEGVYYERRSDGSTRSE